MNIQELIMRGKMTFQSAPKRLEVFKLINGRRCPKEIAIKIGRSTTSVLHDLRKMKDLELIRQKRNSKNNIIKKERYIIYEKNPLMANIPISYFTDSKSKKHSLQKNSLEIKQKSKRSFSGLSLPSANKLREICSHGEEQIYEFKASGADIKNITKKICGFLNTKQGGLLIYGVDDDGTISGSDKTRQEFDDQIQNSIKHTISPSVTVKIKSIKIEEYEIIIIIIPPWNRKDVYQNDGKVLIRKSTTNISASPDELRKLHRGEYVI